MVACYEWPCLAKLGEVGMRPTRQTTIRAVLSIFIIAAAALFCTACGGDEAATTETAGSTPVTVEAVQAPDAAAVVERLQAAGLPIGEVIVYTAETDPNDLLGRPNGYLSKAAFTDTRITDTAGVAEGDVALGGGVEVFADEADAQQRMDYIQSVLDEMGMLGTEYDFVAGPVLLRLSQELTPEQAEEYEQVLR